MYMSSNTVFPSLLVTILTWSRIITGTDHTGSMFPVLFMDHGSNVTIVDLKLYLINSDGGNYQITINSPIWSHSVSLTTTDLMISVPNDLLLKGSEKSQKAFYVEITQIGGSTVEKWPALYSSVSGSGASDSTLVLPTTALGANYYVLTYCEVFGKCQFAIAHNSYSPQTPITITLPTSDDVQVMFDNNVYTSGGVITATLDRYDVIQIQCKCDLTGTHIRSNNDYPIVVFSGSFNAVVGTGGFSDFLVEQMLPTSLWWKEYIVYANPLLKTGDYIRIITSSQNTIIKISGYKTVKLSSSGAFIHRRIDSGHAVYIRADKPIMVVQYTLNDELSDSSKVDSSMFNVQPYEQYHHSYTFHTLTDNGASKSYLSLFLELNNGDESIFIDGTLYNNQSMALTTTALPERSMIAGIVELEQAGRHVVSSNQSFGAYLISMTQGRLASSMIGTKTVHLDSTSSKPMVPGDNVDNDNDGRIDEDTNCDKNDLLVSATSGSKDCTKVAGDLTHKGRRFLLVYPGIGGSSGTVKFDLTAGGSKTDIDYTLYPSGQTGSQNDVEDTHHEIDISSHGMEVSATGIHDKVVLIETDKVSTIYAFYQNGDSMYLYLALPVNIYGLEYYVTTYIADRNNTFLVVGAYDDTVISVHLPNLNGQRVLYDGHLYGDYEAIKITLDQFKVFQIRQNIDLTGTLIRASNPVAVFSGADDYLEQLFPIEYYGNFFVLPQTPIDFETGLLRTVVSEGNTICEINHNYVYTTFHNLTNAGEKIDIYISSLNDSYTIRCNKPAQVVLFTGDTSNKGFMSNIVPTEQYQETYLLTTLNGYGTSYVSVRRSSTRYWVKLTQDGADVTTNTQSTFIESFTNVDARINIYARHNNESYATYLFTMDSSTGIASGTMSGMDFNVRTQICTPVVQTAMDDNIDNDCDGLTDEDVCVKELYKYDPEAYIFNGIYIPDFDIDGSLDEDCEYEATIPVSSTEMVSSSTEMVSSTIAPTMSSTMNAQPSSSMSTSTLCQCPCGKAQVPAKYQNLTEEKIEQLAEELKKELTVDKSTLSSQTRKKTSANDNRPSSKGIGSIGIVFFTIVFGGLILSDLPTLQQQIKMLKDNILKFRKPE